MSGLPRATFEIPLDGGLLTRGDKRAKPEPSFEQLLNGELDDDGGLRVRYPFGPTNTNITGGGTLTNARRFTERNSEQLCFTDTALYSWVPATSSWTYRGDHLAVMTDEETIFAQTSDQFDADRAELNGQVVYAWQTATGGAQVAVRDKTDGTVIQPPTSVGSPFAETAPRLIALSNCVILLTVQFPPGGQLMASKITLSPFAITAPVTVHTTFAGYYDACRVPGRDQVYAAADLGTGSPRQYMIASIDSSLTVASTVATNPINTDPQQIAIAVSPDAAKCTVIINGSTVYAEIWTVPASGPPVTRTTTAAVLGLSGATNAHVTAAYRLVQDSGVYRCYAFWSTAEINFSVVLNQMNWIDTAGTVGLATTNAATRFVYGLGIGARAFARDSHVYLIGTFGGLSISLTDPSGVHGQLQNTYYLYRDDGLLIGKAVWGEGGGFHSTGWLPNVTVDANNPNRFVVMEAIRRIVPVKPNSTVITNAAANVYAERAPREVSFTFDDNRARRTVQFGNTLYVTGSIVLQYDGAALTEVGFCTYPWLITCTAGGAGAIAAAGYSYKATDRWSNAAGETDRSTTATVTNIVIGSSLKIGIDPVYLYVTRKAGATVEVWRTKGNPPDGAPFFLVSSQDPSVVSGDNAYIVNDPTSSALAALSDNLVDASIATLPAAPENAGTLESTEPPGASIIMTDAQRIYLAGIPGFPNTVYYSKYRQPGYVAAFNDFLSFDVPAEGGAIVAIDYLDGGLIVWTETATYQFAGPGYSDAGTGSNFALVRTVSNELGATSQDALNLDNEGWYVKTQRGWHLLDRALTYTYIGAGVYAYDDETVLACAMPPKRHQLRIVTPSRVLVLDTRANKWMEWTIADGLDMLIDSSSSCWYLTPSGPRQELATWSGYAGTDASLTLLQLETQWIKPDGRQQGRYVVDYLQLLAEFRSSCSVQVQLAKDYEMTGPSTPNWHTTDVWTPTTATDGDAVERRTAPARKRCAAIKARITVASGTPSPLMGPCLRLTSLTGQYAVEPGIYGAISAAQKG